jgi:hypothetical protein
MGELHKGWKKENQTITKLLLVQRTMRRPFISLAMEREEDLEDLVKRERDRRVGEERRKREKLSNIQEREREMKMRYFCPKIN